MAKLSGKIENALNESRTLILGVEILLAFDYQSVFQQGFMGMDMVVRAWRVIGLSALLVSAALLIAPAPYHLIVEDILDTPRFLRFITHAASAALFFFALGLAVDFFITFTKSNGISSGWMAGAAALAASLLMWYGIEIVLRVRKSKEVEMKQAQAAEQDAPQKPPLENRVRQIMTEVRVILPGIQALLGFQFAVVLQEGFSKLDSIGKSTHLASLVMIGISTILLMASAAYHRIVDEGEDSEAFLRFTTRMILGGLAFLALGFSGDLFVVVDRVFRSKELAVAFAAAALLVFGWFWFGYTLVLRRKTNGGRSQE